MEVYDVVKNTDDRIILKTEEQLQSLFENIKEEKDVIIRWVEEDKNDSDIKIKRSKLLVTEGLMARIKDGRFILESKKEEVQEEEDE